VANHSQFWHDSAMNLPSSLTDLFCFRADLYACFGRRDDALFELTDAALTAGLVPSLAYLSLEGSHRRGWGSLDAALAKGTLDVNALRYSLARYPLAEGEPVYAVDVSVWPRCDAEASPARGFSYHPSRHSAGQPIVAGWADQWLAQLSFARDSWTAPLDVQRVHPTEEANQVAVEQIKAFLTRRPAAEGVIPLFVFDAGYDPVELAQGLAEMSVAILARLRSDRCFYADPPPARPGPRGGRPRRHGAKLACGDPTTWPPPTADYATDDVQYGTARVQAWANLHAKTQTHPGHGSRQPRPILRGTIIRVEVARLPGRTQKPQVLWLWWSGPGQPDLTRIWRVYVRRFDLEHTLRFCKQTLNWVTPRPRHAAQADRWTWLVVAAYTQIRLARSHVADQSLPWERSLTAGALTPVRVRRALSRLLPNLPTPAAAPKPCGRSPGRPAGKLSGKARRYPVIKKTA
jgi:hypothetical protein